MELNKKAFYFTLDALFGAILIVGGLLLMSQMLVQEESTQSMDYVSKDLLTSLTELKVKEMDDPLITEMISNGTIEDTNNSLLEQIGEFWALGNTAAAKNFTRVVIEDLVPPRLGLRIHVKGEEIYFTNSTGQSNNLVNSRRMVTGVKKGEAIKGSTAASYLKRIRQKKTSSFVYFGGFIGQGNVTGHVEVPDDVDSDATDEILIEADIPSDFEFYLNGQSCGTFSSDSGNMSPDVWNATSCKSAITSGSNEVVFDFQGGLEDSYIGGGFVKIKYFTEEPRYESSNGTEKKLMPGVDGVINIYDSFYAPGNLTGMEIGLHYWVAPDVTLPIFLDIGNKTVYEANLTGDNNYTISNSTLNSLLDYSFLSQKTVPYRLGFYEGNSSNTTGNISDVFLSTSRAGPMGEADIEGTTMTRMELAKNLSHDFIDVVLNASGNRMGLASYFASSQIDQGLTDDNITLHNTVSGYDVQNPSQAQRYLCQNIIDAKSELQAAPASRAKYLVMMTDGNATKCCSSGKCTVEKARQDSIDAACDDYDVTDITVHTIGFGSEADSAMLEEIANCTDGIFRESENYTGLKDIYEELANEVAASSLVYTFQRATEAEGVNSELYGDSYIETTYTPQVKKPQANEISVTFQTEQFDTCNPGVNIEEELRLLEARVTSYSGDHWTDLVSANGNDAYRLSWFGSNYTTLGDPYIVDIPVKHLTGGGNSLTLRTGDSPTNSTGCSMNNSLVYTAAINLSQGRSGVMETSNGCDWTVEFESGNFQNFSVPKDYNGSKQCNYTSSSITYDDEDAYDTSIYNILSDLDFDEDGRVFVDFAEQDLEVEVSVIESVPYLWGPTVVEAEVWG